MNRSSWIQAFRLLLFIGTGVVILGYIYFKQNQAYQSECALRGLDPATCQLWKKVVEDMSHVNPFWMCMALGVYLLSSLFRTWRWQILLEPIGVRTSTLPAFLSIIIGYFTNLGFPRIGELIRATSLAKYEDVEISPVAGTVVTDRIADTLVFAIAILVAIFLSYDVLGGYLHDLLHKSETGKTNNTWILVLGGGILLMTMLGIWLWKYAAKSVFGLKIIETLRGLLRGIASIRSIRRPYAFIALSLMVWLMFYLNMWFSLLAFPPTAMLPWKAALVVFVVGGLGYLLPSPGGMGTFHFLAMQALALYAINANDGFSFANILYFSVQSSNIVIGILAFLWLPILKKQKKSISVVTGKT